MRTALRRGRAAIAGIVAAGIALGVSELLAGLLPGATSLVASVGQVVINLQPPGAKDVVVSLFGTNDKLALELFIVGRAPDRGRPGARGAAPVRDRGGRLPRLRGRRVPRLARRPARQPRDRRGRGAISVGIGLWVLGWLLDHSRGPVAATSAVAVTKAPAPFTRASRNVRIKTRPVAQMPDWSRRSFLIRAGGVGVGAVAAGLVGRSLLERSASPRSATVPRSRRRRSSSRPSTRARTSRRRSPT